VSGFSGLKILFIQDEYDNTETARTWMENLGVHVVYTCVPKEYLECVYPASRFPGVEFIQTLTGYVPIALEGVTSLKPPGARPYLIGYRGRALPYWYGDLGQEKLLIGQRMRQLCTERGIVADIEWDEHKRIYGEQWYRFLENCRATLGTESGANVFDEHGHLRRSIAAAVKADPTVTYAQIHRRYLAAHEGKVMMNQISPKIFEAIAVKTALVLFEGEYSGVIHPHVHYIPLRKDWSNADDVLQKLQDEPYLTRLVERAYAEVLQSGKYSYKQFIAGVDRLIARRATRRANIALVTGLIGGQPLGEGSRYWPEIHAPRALRSLPTSAPLLAGRITVVGSLSVAPVRFGFLQGLREFSLTLKPVVAAKLLAYPRLWRLLRALSQPGLTGRNRIVRPLWRSVRACWLAVARSRNSW
jgi:hypothetical protein